MGSNMQRQAGSSSSSAFSTGRYKHGDVLWPRVFCVLLPVREEMV